MKKIKCYHCEGKIEYDASCEVAGCECPHCGENICFEACDPVKSPVFSKFNNRIITPLLKKNPLKINPAFLKFEYRVGKSRQPVDDVRRKTSYPFIRSLVQLVHFVVCAMLVLVNVIVGIAVFKMGWEAPFLGKIGAIPVYLGFTISQIVWWVISKAIHDLLVVIFDIGDCLVIQVKGGLDKI